MRIDFRSRRCWGEGGLRDVSLPFVCQEQTQGGQVYDFQLLFFVLLFLRKQVFVLLSYCSRAITSYQSFLNILFWSDLELNAFLPIMRPNSVSLLSPGCCFTHQFTILSRDAHVPDFAKVQNARGYWISTNARPEVMI
jgi:hypothetical protein